MNQRFVGICEQAIWVFNLLDRYGGYVPTVTYDGIGVKIEWHEDNRFLAVFLEADVPVRWASGRIGDVVEIESGDLSQVIEGLAAWLSPPSKRRRDD